MKTNPKTPAPKRSRTRKPGKPSLNGRKPQAWSGFAPALCGVMSGPGNLSMREGFARA